MAKILEYILNIDIGGRLCKVRRNHGGNGHRVSYDHGEISVSYVTYLAAHIHNIIIGPKMSVDIL